MDAGIYEMSNPRVLTLDPFTRMGKPNLITELFGGKAGYMEAVQELENSLYAYEVIRYDDK